MKMLYYYDDISLIVSVCCDTWIIEKLQYVRLKISFTFILHAKVAVYVMAASISKNNIVITNKMISL